MSNLNTARDRADRQFGNIANRSEKGSALGLIKAENDAMHAKTARLKALRMAQAEADVAAAPAEPKAKAKKAPARSRAK
ncbi:hypothetical protein [Mangrovicella endophytica]|uniref:hypothetical protein n=1 Tax=Mangrovicella endophytica TaxID=2066697 RepID=UPI000C9E3C58|nr:hypothetical protein [Mangrovicella endophytica]